MERFINFETVRDVSDFSYAETQHPLIRLVDFATEKNAGSYTAQAGLYVIYIAPYDQEEGKSIFIAPGQHCGSARDTLPYHPMGKALFFHADLIRGTSLEDSLDDFGVFSCSPNQSLHLLPREYQLALDIFSNVKMELTHPLDRHSKRLIAANVQLFLNYCERFFSGKFVATVNSNSGVLQRFDKILGRYFSSENPYKFGIPSVAYCAEELHLSANYFGSLVKKETGKTAQEYIRCKLVEEAKHRIINTHKTINEIAYEFGFKYPQHFSRFFRRVVGQNPNEYRNVNWN